MPKCGGGKTTLRSGRISHQRLEALVILPRSCSDVTNGSSDASVSSTLHLRQTTHVPLLQWKPFPQRQPVKLVLQLFSLLTLLSSMPSASVVPFPPFLSRIPSRLSFQTFPIRHGPLDLHSIPPILNPTLGGKFLSRLPLNPIHGQPTLLPTTATATATTTMPTMTKVTTKTCKPSSQFWPFLQTTLKSCLLIICSSPRPILFLLLTRWLLVIQRSCLSFSTFINSRRFPLLISTRSNPIHRVCLFLPLLPLLRLLLSLLSLLLLPWRKILHLHAMPAAPEWLQ